MKTILYATDCTKKAKSALKYAYRLSTALNAKLHVVHVYDLLPIVTTTVRSRSILEKNYSDEQHNLLEDYCNKHLKKEFGVTNLCYHAIKNERIAEGIVVAANNMEADMVLLGAKNRSTLSVVFSGNIANDLMEEIACPLLVLPNDCEYRGLTTLLYATDFEESDIRAIQRLVPIAEPYRAKIKLVHIPRKMEFDYERKMLWFKDMLKQRIFYPEIEFSARRSEDVETGLHDFIEMDKPEILVMMERPRDTFWDRLFHRDMVKTMESEISIPLMVFSKKYLQAKPSAEVDERLHTEFA